jgi:hypothetical protein
MHALCSAMHVRGPRARIARTIFVAHRLLYIVLEAR